MFSTSTVSTIFTSFLGAIGTILTDNLGAVLLIVGGLIGLALVVKYVKRWISRK